ncbi:uncharacterized protein LOC121507307 [Cheilinus undulatus]|uniref:uncharacterized protein LOC121507307 n=1 Tax=Cheilinus undulatus TaxID=241271 RepID=UPI001BD3BEE7|nr:uncharacterized protein LOC121507307 [Cheilinus undulatus]
MSKQSGKKKRIGSRRHGVNHKNTNETDEFLVADSVPVAEHSVLEDKELAFAKPDDSQSQTAASPELTGNRRKLGSSRRHKGGRHVKESETESHHKPREEVEEKTEGEGSPETTQMSPVTQHEEGNFLSKNYEHEIVTHEGLLYFSEELPKVKESKGREESTEIIRLDGNPQSSYMSESNVESLAQPFSPTPDLTEQSECNIQQAELSAPNKELSTKEQQKEIFSLSAEVKDAWQSEKEMKITQLHGTDDENLMHERLPTERISENLNNQAEPSYTYQYKFESTGASAKQEVLNSADKQDEQHKKEDTFEGFVDKTEDYHVCDLVQLASVKANNGLDQVDEKESGLDDDMKPQVDQTFQEMEKNPSGADLNSSSLQMLQSETETYFDSHRQDTFVTRDEQDSDCSPVGNRRKLGSSRKHKIKQIKDSATESYHEPTHEVVENIAGKEGLETEVSLPIETAQRKSEERALAEMTFDTSQFEKLCCPVENQCLLDILDERSPQNQPENESIVEKETVPSSKQQSSTLEEQSEISTLSEIRGAHQSEEAVNTVLEPEFHLTQSQEILEIVHSEILTPNVVEHLEIFSGNPVKQDKVSDQSEFTMRSSDDSVAKQEVSNPVDTHDEHPTKVINIESFDHRKEEYERPRISDDKREDTALDQVFTTQGKVEDDINHTSDQTGYLEKEGLLNQVESKSFQTLPSEISLNSQHLQTNSSLILTAAEMYQGPNEEDNEMTKDNEPSETTKSSLTGETTAEDISIETNMVDSDTFDTVQMEEVGNQLKHDASFGKVVDASGLTSLNFVSEVDQKLVELSTKIPDEELHKITVTEKEHRDKENNFSKPHVNLPANSLVNEQRLNSEEQDSLLKMVVTTENHRPQSGTEFEWSIEHEEFSSQKEELPKNEKQNEVFSSCEAAGVLHSKDTANEVHRKGEEVKQAQVQEIHYPSERVTDDATESSASVSGHPNDQISDLCQPELNVESTDLVTMQDNPNPDGNVFSNQEKVLFEDEDSKSVKTQQSEMISNLEDSAMEYRESTRVREELETSQMQLETETVGQEELSQQTDYDVSIPVPHDGTSNLAITHSGLQNPTPANYPEKNLESPIPESENLQDHGVNEGELRVEECNESMLVPLEGMDTSGTFQVKDAIGPHFSEDAFHDQDVKPPPQMQEKHELDSAGQSVKQSPNISKEMVLSNLIEEAEVSDINQPELTIKSSFDRPSKQEDFPLCDRHEEHTTKSTISEALEQANDDHHPGENVTETHEDEVKPTQIPEEDENIWSTVKEGDSSVQALQAEINVPSDSESQHMNPNGNPIRNRRKLGSSRRSKRQQHVENIVTETLHEPKEECVQKRSNDEAFDVKATEMSSSDLLSGHPKDQVSDLCQPELNVESTDLVTMQDNPNPDGNVFSNQEKVLFEDEDSKSVKTQQSEMISNLEDSAMEYRESTRVREELETSQMQLETETVGQEELSQQTDYDVSIPVPHDGTSNLAITHSGLQNPTPANYPEKNLESPIPESENLQDHGVNEGELRVEECNESMLVPLEGMDTSGTFQDEDTRGAYHSEDAFHDQDVTLPAQTQEKHELDSAGQSVKQSPNISKEMVLSNLIEEAEVSDINQPELTIKSSFDRPSKQEDFPLYDRLEDHPAKSTISEAFEQANDDHHPGENVTETHEDEVKPTQMPEEDENIWSTVKEGDSSVQALQAEINVPSDSESQHMNPNGNPIRNRRKLGSSRRSKRQQHVENIVTETLHEPKEECVQRGAMMKPSM